jgi:hypothetical protein
MGDGTLGKTVGTSGFVGRGDTAGRFVGSQNAGRQSVNNLAQQFSMLRSVANDGSGDASFNTSANQKKQLRPQLQVGFDMPPVAPTTLQASVQTRFANTPNLGERGAGVTLAADETGAIVLTGTVKNEGDRRLMEMLVRLEPGVNTVRNELQVAP